MLLVIKSLMSDNTYQVISEQRSHIVGIQLNSLAEVFSCDLHVTLRVFYLKHRVQSCLPLTIYYTLNVFITTTETAEWHKQLLFVTQNEQVITVFGVHSTAKSSTNLEQARMWRDSRVVSMLDFQSSSQGSSPADRRWSRSNRGPVALCTLGLGLLNPPSLNGR